ncbi:penicillin-binding transpeptidase domain-containing protein [Gordonia sp. TBRC 11910]|uniref:Penicillin-binding transpeptidase domain-containing protein n=1 Tax=Gordonia asplenii TaxID=2725283 RepID=A0A848KNE3_9ACTN|nr:penicillin-binding transpeptidase domain-containing protein [Gordonia asplenii]NMN99789.1 penicillin-binding transpeptidase domain-containing protein [Gordonia asplenii]
MNTIRRRGAALITVLACVALLVGATACSTSDDGPRQAVQRFLNDVASGDVAAAAAQTDDKVAAEPSLRGVWRGLQASALTATAGRTRINADTANVDVDYRWKLPRGREWAYTASVVAARTDGGWGVRWTSTDIHPDLGANQKLVFQVTEAPHATINEADGSTVMTNGTMVGISFDAKAATDAGGNVVDSVTRLVSAVSPLRPDLSAQAVIEQSTASDTPYPIARLSNSDYDRLRDQLAIPGVIATDQAELTATDKTFAPALLSQVKKAVGSELDGTVGWRIAVVNPNGLVADIVTDNAAKPAPAVTLTLSKSVQQAAQIAVNGSSRFKTAMVVIQPSTGNILAIAQNSSADRDGPIATTGLYPPGSTFKMVTASAAITHNLAHPSTPVPCPGEIQIGPRLVPNYDKFSLGTVPMLSAFANSCNTTFAKLASEMGPADLASMAASMGLGRNYTIAGLDAVSGSVPIAPELVSRSEDGFGQGKVLASPLGMALVAATAARGSAPTPQLIVGRPTKVEGPQPTIAPGVIEQLRTMMRAVVTEGTATVIAGQGAVYGKTGEAEFAGGSHAWFAGYRGDLAFATLLVGGGDSTNAVAVTRDFLSMLG